jgi:uncharacterized repeat protein (TIGR03803 family)
MPGKRFFIGLSAILGIFAVTLLASGNVAPAQEEVLHSFGNRGMDGDYPYASLIFDPAGNLYGTTTGGGTHGGGTAFELTPKAGGLWTEKVLYSFNPNGKDGENPYADLIFDAAGNLYGTTYKGGTATFGTVFQLTPQAGGTWKEKVLHSFGNGKDGENPYAGLIADTAGNLYGTTVGGGDNGSGTVFELTPKAGGTWREELLHSFGSGKDGQHPYASLISDSDGNLYGTTFNGGADGAGTVFELNQAGGKWTEKVLHSFNQAGKGGFNPTASLTFDAHGNLYGATAGTIFELQPKAGGKWTEKVLANIGTGTSLVFDTVGNLYGTTSFGGSFNRGTIFVLKPKADGKWTAMILHIFSGSAGDGAYPYGGLIIDTSGTLYGTTYGGGEYNLGTGFEIKP